VSVYVDNFEVPADVPNGARAVRGVWSHMTADTSEELLEMARRIGLRPEWIQHAGTWKEHFDVTLAKKRLAIAAGAIEVSAHEGVRASRARWDAAHPPADFDDAAAAE